MRLTTFFCLVALTFLFAGSASAQRGRTPRTPRTPHTSETSDASGEAAAPAPTLEDLATIAPRLQSPNADEVRAAIDQLSVIDNPAVIPPIVAMLRAGQPDAITERGLEALRGLAHPSSLDVLSEFAHHRRAGVRRRAYLAIAAITDGRVRALLEQGLRDSDRQVRGTCAEQLGRIGARPSLELLFRAFDRGVIEAAAAIGRLGNEPTVERFNEHLGHAPLSVMLSGYEQYLTRTDINEETKIDIVTRLGEVSGRTVREFLGLQLARLGERDRSRLRTVIQDTIRRIPADGETRRTTTTPTPAPAPTGGAR
jgi:HEAT repeat protein